MAKGKIGRNQEKCKRYRATAQREKNKARKAETRAAHARRDRADRRVRENYAAMVTAAYELAEYGTTIFDFGIE